MEPTVKTNGRKKKLQEAMEALESQNGGEERHEEIKILPLEKATLKVRIKGTQPMCMNAFSEKARRLMREKQGGESQVKEPKSPKDCFEAAFYRIVGKGNRIGFPAGALKNAMVSCANTFLEGITKVSVKGALYIVAPHLSTQGQGLVEVKGEVVGGPETQWNEMPVRNASGVADLRYRPLIAPGWTADVEIVFDPSNIKAGQVVNLLNRAGFHVGIGDGRPEKKTDMGWGRFEVQEVLE